MEHPFKKQKLDQEQAILDFINKQAEPSSDPETIDLQWLEKLADSLKKTLETNTDLHLKYPDEPLRFIDSEVLLNSQLKELTNVTLADNPLYNDLIPTIGGVTFENLLNHPNYDIVESVLLLFNDLIDSEYEDDQTELIEWIISSDLVTTLMLLMKKYEAEKKPDEISQEIQIIQSMLTYRSLMDSISNNTNFKKALKDNIRGLEGPEVHSNDEPLLDILWSLIQFNGDKFFNDNSDIMEILLHQLNRFKQTELGVRETEYIETLCLNINRLLGISKGRDLFVQNEGFELLCLYVGRDNVAYFKAFTKVMNSLLGSSDEQQNVKFAVDIIGSSIFLKQSFKRFEQLDDINEMTQFVKLLTKLLQLLPYDSTERVRLINKIVDKKLRNIRLLDKREKKYSKKIDFQFGFTAGPDYSDRLWQGLDLIQQINVLKAWISMEDESIKNELITAGIVKVETLKQVLEGYYEELKANLELMEEGEHEDKERESEVSNEIDTVAMFIQEF